MYLGEKNFFLNIINHFIINFIASNDSYLQKSFNNRMTLIYYKQTMRNLSFDSHVNYFKHSYCTIFAFCDIGEMKGFSYAYDNAGYSYAYNNATFCCGHTMYSLSPLFPFLAKYIDKQGYSRF